MHVCVVAPRPPGPTAIRVEVLYTPPAFTACSASSSVRTRGLWRSMNACVSAREAYW